MAYLSNNYAEAAKEALRIIGKPAKIDKIWDEIEGDRLRSINFTYNNQEPKNTLRNAIRRNCEGVDHIQPAKGEPIFTYVSRGVYGLVEWRTQGSKNNRQSEGNNGKSSSRKSFDFKLPEEISEEDAPFFEGATKQIVINKYERDPKARMKCIEHFGYSCRVCGMSFEEEYGDLGNNFIHVHHIKPLSEIGEGYKVYPEKDMCPVCPNCHAMLHKESPPLSIDDLKEIMKRGKE
jgi:5-methylcytosine-specific restriction protein A